MTDKENPTRKISDEFMLTLHIVDRIYSLLSLFIRYGLPTWALVRIAEALAGKFTFADIAIKVFNFGGDKPWEAITFVALAAWAMLERRLRRKKTAALQGRVTELEFRIDPNRTGSELTNTGETNPDDL
ncbi:MAG: hypothetical protein M3H12_07775 [Chromatiales bacterium]|nr:hypothetical protein [Gammaproteobacteria bacterium]